MTSLIEVIVAVSLLSLSALCAQHAVATSLRLAGCLKKRSAEISLHQILLDTPVSLQHQILSSGTVNLAAGALSNANLQMSCSGGRCTVRADVELCPGSTFIETGLRSVP